MDMYGKVEVEGESGEWELLHNDDPLLFGPQLDSNSSLIRPDHFSLHPNIPNSNSNSNSNSSTTDPSEVDRNFDDSYVVNQLFPNPMLSSSNPKLWNDSDSDTTDANTMIIHEGEVGFDSKEVDEQQQQQQETEETERVVEKEEEEKSVVWWKVPFEVFKYWVPLPLPLPVWSLSVAAAAAFVGLLVLGRRLYKMKRKTQTLSLNLALDDKKVSQLMGRVARLNEAFSVVRRVPIVRPSLPTSSVTMRPVMSMR